MANPFLEEMRTLAAEDLLEEVLPRVRGFLQSGAFAARDRELENEGLGFLGRLADHQKRARKGLMAPEQIAVERNRLRANLFDYLDAIEKAIARVRLPATLPAGAASWPAVKKLEKIIGADRMKSITWLHAAIDAARPVGRIVGTAFGTGFLVQGGWLVTNHHVLPSRDDAAQATLEMNFQEDGAGKRLVPSRYKLDADSWKASPELDCACVRVSGGLEGAPVPEIASWGTLPWAPAARAAAVGDYVSIIQHPYGGRKRIAVSENQVVSLHAHLIHYQTDTEEGSSGSPVLNDRWEVVALHHAGGHLEINEQKEHLYINEGILASRVRDALGV